jgi:hypothetical protein
MYITLTKNSIISLNEDSGYAICTCKARHLCKEIDDKKVRKGIKYKVLGAKIHKGIRDDLPEIIGVYASVRRGWYRVTWVDFIDELFSGSPPKAFTITKLYLREEGLLSDNI